MAGDRERCLAAGCDDYLTKPIKTRPLREMLARYVSAPLAAAAAAAPPMWPGLDSSASAAVDGLRRHFLSGLPQRARAVEEAWQSGDRAALVQTAHQLKGTAGAYGQTGLAQAAEVLEARADSDVELAELQAAVTTLSNLCRAPARQDVKSYRKQPHRFDLPQTTATCPPCR